MLAALAIVVGFGQGSSSISCTHCTVTIAGTPVAVRGTITSDRIDATAYAARWRLGGLATVRDVVVTAHGSGATIHACAAGTVLGVRLVACADVPRSIAQLHAVAIAWHAIGGAASGHFELRIANGDVRVARAAATILGGTIDVDPFDVRAGATAMLHVHGLPLARVLDLTTLGHVRGTGVLDGDIAAHLGDDGLALDRGTLHARTAGNMQMPATPELGRAAEVLADFSYDHLAMSVGAQGRDPDSTLVVHGRGKRVPQELELTINLHGARALVSRLDR